MLVTYLPQDAPSRWHVSDDRPWSQNDSLLWQLYGAALRTNVNLARLGGNKKAVMPWDEQPKFPWRKPENPNSQTLGGVSEERQDEAIEYLLGLDE